MRKSSLVEWRGTENVTRLKPGTEDMESVSCGQSREREREQDRVGRGAFLSPEKLDRKDWWRGKK